MPERRDDTIPARSAAAQRLGDLTRHCGEALAKEAALVPATEHGAPSLERLLEISQAMNRIHDRERLLSGVSDWLCELFDAENGFVVLFRADGRPEVLSCHTKEPLQSGFPVSETILSRVRTLRETILIDDTAEQPDLRDQSSVERLRIASVLCAPLIVGDEVIGVLQFDHRGEAHPFPAADRRLLELFAGQAATAFHNLQLIEELDRTNREMELTQAKLVQAERLSAVGEMATGIAHNFNNTLFVALGFCDVMLARDDLNLELRTSIERIRTCSLDAANTVRRLQILSQGRSTNEPHVAIDPGKEVKGLIELIEPRCHQLALERGISVELATSLGPTPPVFATESDLREIVSNMVLNAVEALREDGTVTVATGVVGGEVFLSVADEGIGMDEATRKRIFEPFFTTKPKVGSGFGLSTSWSIARHLGGRITVESTPAQGSTFTLWLPEATRETAESSPAKPVGTRRARILVIDDDPRVLETIRVLVELMGHDVTNFQVPEEALEKFDEVGYDLVITDLNMPGLTGEEVVRRLRQQHPEVPVVVLTGIGNTDHLDRRVAGSIRAVLAKPVTLDVLRSSISRALDWN